MMNGFSGLSIGKGRSGRGELKKASITTAGLEPPALRRGTSDDVDSLAVIEERLGSLCDCISRDVVPGLERELGQVRGWLAMLDAAPSVGKAAAAAEGTAGAAAASAASTTTGDNEAERRKMLARQELEALTTAVEVFKTALGKLYTPRRSSSF